LSASRKAGKFGKDFATLRETGQPAQVQFRYEKKYPPMQRRTFLNELGLTMAAACTCGLAACSKSSGSNGITPPTNVSFTLDLNTVLLSEGDFLVKNGVIVARVNSSNAASSFTAVSAACTHEGTIINYNESQGIFICPLHGSQYSKTGVVLLGPAMSNLRQYNVAVSGTDLTITG